MTSVLKWVAGDKKMREKAIQAAVKYAAESEPLIRTIQTGLGTYGIKKTVGDIGSAVDDVNDLVSKISDVANRAKQFVPSMQVMGKSFADSVKIFAQFNSIATAAGIGANIILAYQGVKAIQLIDARLKDMAASLAAQTALIAQKDFPQYVYDMIQERVTQTSLDPNCDHWFFVYHPDNDWYPGFYRIMHNDPIGPEFCGYTNQIDTAFVFMLAARRRIEKKERRAQKEGRAIRPTRLHLLIPAYQPILILEALKIPEEIGDFVMEGRINSNREFVWLNLPEDQRHYVQDIGHFVPPTQGFFDWAMSEIGLVEAPPKLGVPRVLGTRQGLAQGDDEVVETVGVGELEQVGNRSTQNQASLPLQHQTRRHRKR
ncbi:hypothetical protein jhhlp_002884 [Lomentospora prolificans]|uniref:Uncharacterized protein n=1 Tax=Lomentospora prolificans TaxID=41688 RepID=A0A2N3NFB2_9PEZI|nr:hypothetical protein jhhlp_002884 [Lomentospora prolificans]